MSVRNPIRSKQIDMDDLLVAMQDLGIVTITGSNGYFLYNTAAGATAALIYTDETDLGIGTTTLSAHLTIKTTADAKVGLTVQGYSASQSANIFTVQNHSGTVLFGVEPDGDLVASGNTVTATEFGYLSGVTSSIQNQIDNFSAEVVDDTTPQLGGNLDTNSFQILFDDAHGIFDDSSNEQLIFSKTASAVNHFQIANAATGNGPTLSAIGDNTNIDINVTPKGTGATNITTGNFTVNGTSSSGTFTVHGASVSDETLYVTSVDENTSYAGVISAVSAAGWAPILKLTNPSSSFSQLNITAKVNDGVTIQSTGGVDIEAFSIKLLEINSSTSVSGPGRVLINAVNETFDLDGNSLLGSTGTGYKLYAHRGNLGSSAFKLCFSRSRIYRSSDRSGCSF